VHDTSNTHAYTHTRHTCICTGHRQETQESTGERDTIGWPRLTRHSRQRPPSLAAHTTSNQNRKSTSPPHADAGEEEAAVERSEMFERGRVLHDQSVVVGQSKRFGWSQAWGIEG
jgi:hypothetical protein